MPPEPGRDAVAQGLEAQRLAGGDGDRAEHDHLGLDQHHERSDPPSEMVDPARQLLPCEGITRPSGLDQMLRTDRLASPVGPREDLAIGGRRAPQASAPGIAPDVGLQTPGEPAGAGHPGKGDRQMPDLPRATPGAAVESTCEDQPPAHPGRHRQVGQAVGVVPAGTELPLRQRRRVGIVLDTDLHPERLGQRRPDRHPGPAREVRRIEQQAGLALEGTRHRDPDPLQPAQAERPRLGEQRPCVLLQSLEIPTPIAAQRDRPMQPLDGPPVRSAHGHRDLGASDIDPEKRHSQPRCTTRMEPTSSGAVRLSQSHGRNRTED